MTLIAAFTGTDATALTSYTPDAGGSFTNHSSWASSSATIRTNRAAPGSSESVVYHSGTVADRTSASWSVSGALKYVASNSGSYGGLWAGVTGAKTGYVVYWYAGDWTLYKYSAGSGSSLGTYTSSVSVGDTNTIEIAFSPTQVIFKLNGTARITANDTAITPTRIGVYGATSDATKGHHVDDLTYTPPDIPDGSVVLYESGTHQSQACGTDKYGRITLVAEHTKVARSATGATLQRSADGGSTWATITSGVTVSNISGDNWKIIDARPQLGSQPQSGYGSGSVKYKVTMTGPGGDGPTSSATSAVTSSLDTSAVVKAQGDAALTYRAGLGTNYVPTSSMLQPGQWLMLDAYCFLKYTLNSWANASSHLTNCQNQWTYIKSLARSSGAASGLLCLDGNTAVVETDAHFRPILHTMECARLLQFSGDATAATLAADMVSYCQTWAKNGIDKMPRATRTYNGWDANSQTAWQASHAYSVGDLVRPTSTNGRSYRCYTAGTSSGSEPTWPTSTGGTVTDGSVVWKETTRANSHFAHIYSVGASTLSAASTSYLVNKELVVAAALAMLMSEQSATDFYTGGSYNSTAQAIIDANIDTACSAFTNSDGSMPYSDGTGMASGLTQNDTLYGAFCTSTLATVYKLGLTSDWQVSPAMSKALDWLESGNYSTEPLACEHRTGLGSGISPGGDIAFRFAAYTVLSRSNPTRNLIFTAAFNDPATGYPTDYTQYGGGTAYAGYALGDIFDGLTLEAAVTTVTYETYTADGVVAARNTQTYTADGVVTGTTTKTYTADGVVTATMTRTYTAGGVVDTAAPEPPHPPADPDPAFRMFFNLGPYL